MKINCISPQDNKYTSLLSNIVKPPKSLYYIGILPDERLPTVAIVGSRKPTKYGNEVTERFARELAQRGVVIISGLAIGVDGIAHTAALEAKGLTLAVLGNGLPDIYPSTHAELAKRIVDQGGAIVTEYEEGRPVMSHQFLERNRIVSGLADAILITEAAARSGTLNTAAHALEQGKEVFVVPGNITSPMSVGCNQLLKQGARVATSVDDILEVIAPNLLSAQQSLALGNTPLETSVLEQLKSGVRDGDEIQTILGCTATDLSVALTMLELAGTIRALGGNQWTIR
ncbi:MAG: DNA-processing protein DprA [Candidatus Saccharimonas sp.]